jgi:ribonuclease G
MIGPIDDILIDRDGAFVRAVGFAQRQLADIAREPADRRVAVGAIHRVRVAKAAQGGVFVDLPGGLVALLDTPNPPPPGRNLLVQIVEPPLGDKRARVSTRLALESANAVLLPGGKGASVSKRVSAAKREALQARAHTLSRDGEGLILRGGAIGLDDAALAAEIDALRATAVSFVRDGAPEMLLSDGAVPALVRTLNAAEARVVTSDADLAKLAGIPHDPHAFDRYDAASLLEKLESPRVDLPSGAWLSIERTAALVAIDVNSGTAKGDALTVDVEAAREIARHVRLRDLAGLIVVDVLRLVKPGERARLLDAFKHATRFDRRRVDVLGFTAGGLVEMTRARSRAGGGE